MNNKEIGTDFEQEMCEWLASQGWWVHFISPDRTGAQPFDIIAVMSGNAIAIDCKTVSRKTISYDRLEENQIMAFEKWLAVGNSMPLVMVKYNGYVYKVSYRRLKVMGKIDLTSLSPLYKCEED